MKFLILAISAILILLIPFEGFSSENTQKTVLRLHDFGHPVFNGGQPIVFEGKLETENGTPVSKAKIVIKGDGPCPEDGIIATGLTDKKGRFWLYTITMIWDESDNMITVHAEFNGNQNYSSAISRNQVVIVYPSHAEKCMPKL